MMGGGMMQGGMMGRGMMGGGMQAPASASAASKAYIEGTDKMCGPIMEGPQADDPDIAFVRAMIAQRQDAIELAKVRLQYGKDEQTREWAYDTIQRQQVEIDETQAWLKKQVVTAQVRRQRGSAKRFSRRRRGVPIQASDDSRIAAACAIDGRPSRDGRGPAGRECVAEGGWAIVDALTADSTSLAKSVCLF